MTKSITKADLVWLTYNTEICNVCHTVDDCSTQDIVFQTFRPHHIEHLRQIFADYKIANMKDQYNNKYAQIIGFSIEDLYLLMYKHGGDMFLNKPDNKVYYVPIDKIKYRHIFNRASTKMLSNLPDDKKINILKSLRQRCYMSAHGREKSEEALEKKTKKLLALLQVHIPPQFFEDELRKVRLITHEISQIPNIKEDIESFKHLPIKRKQELLRKVSEITAKYNRIDTPSIHFPSQKQIDKDEGIADWISTEAFACERNVYINKNSLKNADGMFALSLAWHETTHVAQSYGDYSKYPLVEELFNQNLDFLQKMSETYLFHPQEKVVYALERHFIENIIKYTGAKTTSDTFEYTPEYNIAGQYIHRDMRTR